MIIKNNYENDIFVDDFKDDDFHDETYLRKLIVCYRTMKTTC